MAKKRRDTAKLLMSLFSKKHPHMAAKIADQIETLGYTPEQIMLSFKEQDDRKALEALEGTEMEVFADEILIISQPLAYRQAELSDIDAIHSLLSAAYQPEVEGPEAFRGGESVPLEEVRSVFSDPSYHWVVAEAPSGRNVELDGLLLAVSCFCCDGVARRDGNTTFIVFRVCNASLFLNDLFDS